MDGAQCVDALLALSHPQDAAALSADEGLALMSILSVVPTKLPDKHRLFACLQCSVLAAESMDGFMSALRVAVALGQETSHAHALSAMLESCHEAMDRAVAIAISHDEPLAEMKMDHLRFAALKTDPVVALSSSVLCPAAVELLALLVLLLLLVSFKDNSVSASTVLELLQNDLDLTVRVLARTLESAIGVVPGVSPTVREPRMQRYVAHSILRILVQLTSWTTYSSVYCRRNPNQFGTTSMQAQSGAFRVHVYRVSCAFIQTRILLSLTAYAQQQWLRGVDSSAMADVVRELLFLINNILTLTNVGVVQLRGFIAATKFVQHLLMPFLILQFQELHGCLKDEESTARRCLPAFYASCGLCCEVLATLCFGNRLMQQQLSSRISDVEMGVLLEEKNVPVSSSLAAPRGVREVDARVRSNFVSQLIRLCINGNLEQDVVLQQTRLVWERLLTEREKDSMRWAMVNPMRRRQPIDIHSRNYAFFQQLLVLPAELTSSKDAEGQVAPAAQAGGGARGQASNRGASRRRGRGRRRKQRRYAQLKERQAPPPTAGHAAPKKSGVGSASTQAQSTVANQPTDSKKNLAAVDGVERNHLNADEEEHQLAQLESSDEEDDEEDAPHREQGGDDGSTSEADDDGAGHARTGGLDLRPWRTRSAPPMGIPSRYICSLTLGIIQSVPMLSPRGLLFDRDKILDFLRVHRCCPVTGDSLYPNDLIADEDLEKELRAVRFQFINLM